MTYFLLCRNWNVSDKLWYSFLVFAQSFLRLSLLVVTVTLVACCLHHVTHEQFNQQCFTKDSNLVMKAIKTSVGWASPDSCVSMLVEAPSSAAACFLARYSSTKLASARFSSAYVQNKSSKHKIRSLTRGRSRKNLSLFPEEAALRRPRLDNRSNRRQCLSSTRLEFSSAFLELQCHEFTIWVTDQTVIRSTA